MSDGGTHVGLTTSPIPLTGAAASGGLGALTSHSAPTAPLVVRGGATPLLDPPVSPSLPRPGLALALFPSEAVLAPSFKAAAEHLPAGRRLVDLLGSGDCGFNCLAGGLALLGLLPCSDDTRRAFCCSPRLIVPWGQIVRSRIVAHARLPRVLGGLVAAPGTDDRGAPMPFAHAIMSSFASWPGLASSLAQHGVSFSVEGWRFLMNLEASGDRFGTYMDEACLIAAADCFSLRIECHVVSGAGVEQQGSPQIFLPLDGVVPRHAIVLWVQPDVHFVLEIAVLPEARASAVHQSGVLTTGLLEWRARVGAVHRLGGDLARLQGEALAARHGLSCQAAGMSQADGGSFYSEILLQLSRKPPIAPLVGANSQHQLDEDERSCASLNLYDDLDEVAASHAISRGTAPADLGGDDAPSGLQRPADPALSEARCSEPAAGSSTLAKRLCEAEDEYEAGTRLYHKRVRTQRHLLTCEQAMQPSHRSACVLLFGISDVIGEAAVLLVCFRVAPHAAQPISELRDASDTSAPLTALRGVTEELLGLAEGSAEAAACVAALSRRLDDAGFEVRHLGADLASSHRSFAMPADVLFDGGIDDALARFRANAEMGSATLVPLRGLTGRLGETSVVDGWQRRHQLRGGRHLGEGRIDFIRRYLGRRSILWGTDEGPPPPPPSSDNSNSGVGNSGGATFAPSAAPRGGGSDGAPPPSDDDFGDCVGASRAAVLESEWAAASAREWRSFSWPLTSVAEVQRLLCCSHIAPTDIVGFEFSGAVRQALEAAGRRALSVDRRACDVGGMHAVLDVRDVVPLACWRRAFFFPPCFQQLRADEDCLQAKIDDGRAFWGCALVIWCFCTPSELLMVEQPDTIVADFLPLEFLETRTSAFGDSPDKYVRLYLHNCQLTPPFAPDPAARRRPPHYLAFPNSDARDRAKSTWRPYVRLCRSLARLLPAEEPTPAGLDYSSAIETFAAAWYHEGFPVPRGYANAFALPPSGSRRYQLVRGPGDGRRVDAVVPASVTPRRPRGGAGTAVAEPAGGLDVRTATASCALLLYVATLLQPLVYAHANGFNVQGVLLPDLAPRASYVQAVQGLVSAAVGAAKVAAFMVGEYLGGARLLAAPLDFRPPRRLICMSRAERLLLLAAGGGWAWMTLAALAGTPVSDAAHRAVLACDAFVKPGYVLADFPSEALGPPLIFRTGAATAVSVLSRPTLQHIAAPPAWHAISAAARDSQLLIAALNRASDDALLAGWVDRIKPLDPGDIPDALLRALPSFTDEGLEHQPFSPLYRPLVTPWLPLPPLQAPANSAMPSCVRSPFEMMLPATQTLVVSWLRHTMRDLRELRDATEAGTAHTFADGTRRRDRPRPLAVGRLELHAWARDRVWDCRAACCQLLDFRAPIRTHLNLEYLRTRLQTYPDRYLVANVLEGVRLDADVELQSVFVPHLVSLPLGYRSVAKELRRLHGLGWYAFFPDFPFWPLYLNGQGANARRLEPDRYRRTTEGGGPRQPTFDLEGLQALSINAASFTPHMPVHFIRDDRPEMRAWLAARGLPPSETATTATAAGRGAQHLSKWPKEAKPKLCELMHDLAILKRAAQILGVPVYIFGDDARDYFNQLAMAECELHKVNIVFLSEDGDLLARDADASTAVPTLDGVRLIFVSELRLGFGTHGASNIAQRFSEALLNMFREDMDREELPFFEQPSAALQRWLTSRLEVSRILAAADLEHEGGGGPPTDEAIRQHYLEQRRLYAAWCYTDDPVWIVVDVDRTLRALRVWRRLTDNVGLLMAIPEKRNLGVHATWLGVLIITALAIVVVPRGKLLRAAAAVSGTLQGGQPFHVYRSLIGLLEHLRAVNLRGRNVMHGLYAPHRPDGASRFGPSGRVYCDDLMLKQLQRWRELLQHSAGVSVRLAFEREQMEPSLSGITVHASSDACFGDPEPDGIGGFCHGLYWQFLVPPCDRDVLSTPVLEFLGVAFNIIGFCEHAASLCGSTGTLLLTTDALTTALVLPRETQRSPIMIDAYQLLTETAAWRRLLPRLRVRHCFGETMFLADPLSRSRWREFRSRCAQLGVRPHGVPLPQECRRIFDLVVQLERARRLAASRLAPAIAAGASGFLERLKRPPIEPVAEPNWLRRRLAPAVATAEAPQLGFLQRLRQQSTPSIPIPPTPAHTVAAGLSLPIPPPRPSTASARPTSSLQIASAHYAQMRAMALAAGSDPSMRIRADLAELHRASESISEISEFGTNSNTLRKDDRAWEFWEIICERLGTSPFRTEDDVRTNPGRQAFLLAVLMLYSSSVCVPRTAGRHCIKPRSALAYPLAIIRIFGRWGIQMPGFKALQAQLQGLQRSYIAYHGPKSLAPKRAEPMRFSMVRDINALKCDGSISIKSRRWTDDDQAVFMFRRLNLLQMRGGWRLAEWVYHSSGEIMYICRSDLWWRINGVIIKDATPEQLRRLRPGDCAFVAPPRSKPDQSGEIHCSFPVVYVFNYEADNAAAALRDIELRHPCHGVEREARPVIADENGNPFTHSVLDTILHNVLVYLFGAAMASLFSWHSYRSGLCTALFAAGCPDALNQLICRWMCPESLHVYRRLGTLQNADWVERAASARVDTIQSGNAPRVSNDESWGELFRETNSRARGSPLMQDWASAKADAAAPKRPLAAAARPTVAHAPAPAAVPPLTAASTVGCRALVPAAVYPQYACSERGGAGWECLVISATGVSAVVRFLYDRTADGRPYADERLPLSALQPL